MRRLAVLLLLMTGLAACAGPPPPACGAPYQPVEEVLLFFGRDTPAGEVSEAEWQAFLEEVLVPAFPDGATVLDGEGRWFDDAAGRSGAERSKLVLLLVFEPQGLEARIGQVAERYAARFQQQAVLAARRPLCAASLAATR